MRESSVLTFVMLLLFFSTYIYAQKYVGAAKDDKFIQKAIKTLIQEAKNGNAESQYCVGMHYLNGTMIEKDTKTALKWLENAKNNHYAKAFELLKIYKYKDILGNIIYLGLDNSRENILKEN